MSASIYLAASPSSLTTIKQTHKHKCTFLSSVIFHRRTRHNFIYFEVYCCPYCSCHLTHFVLALLESFSSAFPHLFSFLTLLFHSAHFTYLLAHLHLSFSLFSSDPPLSSCLSLFSFPSFSRSLFLSPIFSLTCSHLINVICSPSLVCDRERGKNFESVSTFELDCN